MNTLETHTKGKEEQKRFDNLNFELHNQEDLFQELVLEYNTICKKNKIFVNSSLSMDKEFESGLRIGFKHSLTSKKVLNWTLKIINRWRIYIGDLQTTDSDWGKTGKYWQDPADTEGNREWDQQNEWGRHDKVIYYQGDKMDSILKKQEEVQNKAVQINKNLKEVRKEGSCLWMLYFLGGFVFLGVFLIIILKSKLDNSLE